MKMCVVAARSGSKGLPDKNIREFAGKPLLAHSVEQAVATNMFDIVALSSDSEDYLAIGKTAGANLEILRPHELATDYASKPSVLRHALLVAEAASSKKIDVIFDLQPTSPLRRVEDIEGAGRVLAADDSLSNVISVCEAKASPYYTLVEQIEAGRIRLVKASDKFTRRQDIPKCYELNGSIYAWRRQGVLDQLPSITRDTGIWLMPEECNFDIDTPLDFALAAFVARTRFGWPETALRGLFDLSPI